MIQNLSYTAFHKVSPNSQKCMNFNKGVWAPQTTKKKPAFVAVALFHKFVTNGEIS